MKLLLIVSCLVTTSIIQVQAYGSYIPQQVGPLRSYPTVYLPVRYQNGPAYSTYLHQVWPPKSPSATIPPPTPLNPLVNPFIPETSTPSSSVEIEIVNTIPPLPNFPIGSLTASVDESHRKPLRVKATKKPIATTVNPILTSPKVTVVDTSIQKPMRPIQAQIVTSKRPLTFTKPVIEAPVEEEEPQPEPAAPPIISSFDCSDKIYGYYADVENECRVYHICVYFDSPNGVTDVVRYSYRCPLGTWFDQSVFSCVNDFDRDRCLSSPDYYILNENFGKIDKEIDSSNRTSSVPRAEVSKDVPKRIIKKPSSIFHTKATPTPSVFHTTTASVVVSNDDKALSQAKPQNLSFGSELNADAESINASDSVQRVAPPIRSSFSCVKRGYGYYADVELSCSVYHVCVQFKSPNGNTQTVKFSYRCPAGTWFDQRILSCTDKFTDAMCTSSPLFYYLNANIGKTKPNELEVETRLLSDETKNKPTLLGIWSQNLTEILDTEYEDLIITSFSCADRKLGYYADVDNNCTLFHLCDNETMHSFTCPEGTAFDQSLFSCVEQSFHCADAPKYYHLNEQLEKIVLDDLQESSNFSCKGKEEEDYPDVASECRRFFQCRKAISSGVPRMMELHMECPKGTRFDVITKKCKDETENIVCQ